VALKRGLILGSITFSMVLICPDFIMAQMEPIYRFKNTNIPVGIIIKDQVLEKGAYDLDFCRTSSPVLYFVRIMKKGKILDILQGEEFPYDFEEGRRIAGQPTLKMSRNQNEKTLVLIFESGILAKKYSKLRARFIISYED